MVDFSELIFLILSLLLDLLEHFLTKEIVSFFLSRLIDNGRKELLICPLKISSKLLTCLCCLDNQLLNRKGSVPLKGSMIISLDDIFVYLGQLGLSKLISMIVPELLQRIVSHIGIQHFISLLLSKLLADFKFATNFIVHQSV